MPLSNLKFLYATQENLPFVSNTKFWLHKNKPVIFVTCEFQINRYSDSLFEQMGIRFPQSIKRSVVKRRAEFLSGRYSAKQALKHPIFNLQNIPDIPIGVHNSPVWPKAVRGSITHNSTNAVCAVGLKSDIKFLGIDIECILTEQKAKNISSLIHDSTEANFLLTKGIQANKATTLIFSAKESLFKALYPFVNEYFDFQEAKVKILDTHDQTIKLELEKPFRELHNLKQSYLVKFEFYSHFVITMLIE